MSSNQGSYPSAAHLASPAPPEQVDPALEALVREIIGSVADKWTMLVLETLEEQGRMRFTQLGNAIGGVSQKMLTQTVRRMEADGLVTRTIYPVVPPRVEYELTEMGKSLGAAFCGVWIWAEQHRDQIEQARKQFREQFQEREQTAQHSAPVGPAMPRPQAAQRLHESPPAFSAGR